MNIKLVVLLTLIIGVGALVKISHDYDVNKKGELLTDVKVVRSAINVDRVKNLTGSEDDLINPDYLRLKEQLTYLSDAIPGVKYIYLMARQKEVIFLVDTQPSKLGEGDLAKPGEIYSEADADISRLLTKKEEIVVGPETDKWGTFVSGLASITEKNSNKVIALVGVDVDASTWQGDRWRSLIPGMGLLILGIAIEVLGYLSVKKTTKNSLKMSYLASVLESSNDAIYSIDFNRKILSWNAGAEKLFGFSAEEVVGKKITDYLLPTEEIDSFNDNMAKLAMGRRINHQETVRKTKQGKLITVSLTLSPVIDEIGRVNSVSVIARDITQQHIETSKLQKHNMELEKMNKMMIDRELAMAELKNKLKKYETNNK